MGAPHVKDGPSLAESLLNWYLEVNSFRFGDVLILPSKAYRLQAIRPEDSSQLGDVVYYRTRIPFHNVTTSPFTPPISLRSSSSTTAATLSRRAISDVTSTVSFLPLQYSLADCI